MQDTQNQTLDYKDLREQLLLNGFFVIDQVLPQNFVLSLNQDIQSVFEGNREKCVNLGSLVDFTYQTTNFCKLICWQKTWEILTNIGFPTAKYWTGYIVCKEPKSPKSYWHQDWAYWNHPISSALLPPQLFVMYYMVPTTTNNGCLRVIKGSHRKKLDLHQYINNGHDHLLYNSSQNPLYYDDHPEQTPVQVKPGDIIIGDARGLSMYLCKFTHR